MRKVRATTSALVTVVLVVAGSARAFAAQASPSAGGAQPLGSSSWNEGFIKVLIVGVPLVITVALWLVLARTKPKA
jgi:hypothetical protein